METKFSVALLFAATALVLDARTVPGSHHVDYTYEAPAVGAGKHHQDTQAQPTKSQVDGHHAQVTGKSAHVDYIYEAPLHQAAAGGKAEKSVHVDYIYEAPTAAGKHHQKEKSPVTVSLHDHIDYIYDVEASDAAGTLHDKPPVTDYIYEAPVAGKNHRFKSPVTKREAPVAGRDSEESQETKSAHVDYIYESPLAGKPHGKSAQVDYIYEAPPAQKERKNTP